MERTCGDVLFLLSQDGPLSDHVPAFAGITPAGQGRLAARRRSGILAAYPSPAVCLPGRLANPGNLSPQRQSAEAQPAKAELAQIGARASAQLAAVVLARRELGLLVVLGDAGCSGHRFLYLSATAGIHSRGRVILRSLASQLPAAVTGCRKKNLIRAGSGTACPAASAEPVPDRRSSPWSRS